MFAEFDPTPLAAASIGQTHCAVLCSGERVVVKVQRPGIAQAMERDLAALALVANFAQRRTELGQEVRSGVILDQIAQGLRAELDFRQEARAMEEMAELLRGVSGVRVPYVHQALCTRRLLVQEQFHGATVADAVELDGRHADRAALADQLMRATLHQVLRAGFFHADPHPGNIFVLSDGTLGLIDFGAVGRLDSIQKAAVIDMLVAVTERDASLLREGIERVADGLDTTSPEQLERVLARLMADHVRPTGTVDPTILQDLVVALARFHVALPRDLVVLARTLVTLEGTLRLLAPEMSFVHAAMTTMQSKEAVVVDQRAMIRDELLAVAAAPAPPAGTGRPHPDADRPRRAARAHRPRRGRPPSRAHTCQPGPAGRRRRHVPRRLGDAHRGHGSRPARRRDRRAVRRLRLRRSAPRHRAPAARRRHGRSGRHDMSSVATATAPAQPTFDDRPAGERYYRHPGDVVRSIVWGLTTVLLVVFLEGATQTSRGLTVDLGHAAARVADAARELVLALTQVLVVLAACAVIGLLVALRRWRRLGIVVLAGAVGAGVVALLDRLLDLPGPLPQAVSSGTWLASTRFPNLAVLGGAAAVAAVGKPWLSRSWARATNLALAGLLVAMGLAGSGGLPELLLAFAAGTALGALILVAFGSPNRRPSPATVAAALRAAGVEVEALHLRRAVGGRAQLYRATTSSDADVFVKVYSSDSRDADLLYRGYRVLVLRGPNDGWPSPSLDDDARREAFLLLLSESAGVRAPGWRRWPAWQTDPWPWPWTTSAVSGSTPSPLRTSTRRCSTGCGTRSVRWRRRASPTVPSRAGNILVVDGEPVVIDFGFAQSSATTKMLRIDHAELLASLGSLVGAAPAVEAAARALSPDDLAAIAPYLQPLALTAATRKRTGKAVLREFARADRHRVAARP